MKTATETIEMPFEDFEKLVKTMTLGEVMSLKNFFLMKFNEVNAVVKSLENKFVESKSKNDLGSVQSCEDHIKIRLNRQPHHTRDITLHGIIRDAYGKGYKEHSARRRRR